MSFGNLCILRYKFKFTDSIILLIPTPTPMGFFCYFIFSSKISTFFFFNIYLFIWLHWSYWRHMGSSVITAVCGIFSYPQCARQRVPWPELWPPLDRLSPGKLGSLLVVTGKKIWPWSQGWAPSSVTSLDELNLSKPLPPHPLKKKKKSR